MTGLAALVNAHHQSGVLVDTNLLLLYFVGGEDRRFVETFKRLNCRFVPEDLDTVTNVLGLFRRKLTTSSVLAELSNLVGQLPENTLSAVRSRIAAEVAIMRERHIKVAAASASPAFVRFGFTDAVLRELAQRKVLVFSDDFPLVGSLRELGLPVLAFSEVRLPGWR